MLIVDAAQIRAAAPMPQLIEQLRGAFRAGGLVPPRQIIPLKGDGLLVTMPAVDGDGCAVVKLATLLPDNPKRELPAIQAALVMFSEFGEPKAVLDGTIVTHLRTGAASALASSYLSRADSTHLVILGTGALAPFMALGHCAVRPIQRISVWGRRAERANAAAAAIRSLVDTNIEVLVPTSIEAAVATANIVCCATNSAAPVLAGKWLTPGVFIDLVGSFSPVRREADDDVILRSRIFVDTFEGALSEAGDLLDPISRGILDRQRVEAELADLVRGQAKGRVQDEEIILFKSVGTAVEDLAAARMIVAAVESGTT
jgi:ornithine cyclodeaminase